jgi:hypothetical protein
MKATTDTPNQHEAKPYNVTLNLPREVQNGLLKIQAERQLKTGKKQRLNVIAAEILTREVVGEAA